MKKATKIEELATELKNLKDSFPHQERMMWAIKNEVSLYTVDKYLRGEPSSIITAEKLIVDIKAYLKGAAKVAA